MIYVCVYVSTLYIIGVCLIFVSLIGQNDLECHFYTHRPLYISIDLDSDHY